MSNPFTRESEAGSPPGKPDGMPWLLPKADRKWRIAVPKVSSGVGLQLFQEHGSSIVVGGFLFSIQMSFIEGIQSHARWEPNHVQIGDHVLAVNDEWVQGKTPIQVEEQLAGGAPGTTVLLRMMRKDQQSEKQYQVVLKRQSLENPPATTSNPTSPGTHNYSAQPTHNKSMAARKLWMPDVAYEAEARRGVVTPVRYSPSITVSSAPSAEVASTGPRLPQRTVDLKVPNASFSGRPSGHGSQISAADCSTSLRAPAGSSPGTSGTAFADYSFGTSPGHERIRGPPLARSSLPWYVENDSPAKALELSKSPIEPPSPDMASLSRQILPKPLPTSPAAAGVSRRVAHAQCQTDAVRAERALEAPPRIPAEAQLQLGAREVVVLHVGRGAIGTRRLGQSCWCRKSERKCAVTTFARCSLVATCAPSAGELEAAMCAALRFFFFAEEEGKFRSVNLAEGTKINVKGRRVELVQPGGWDSWSHIWLYGVPDAGSMSIERCLLGRWRFEEQLRALAKESSRLQSLQGAAGQAKGGASASTPAKAQLGYLKAKTSSGDASVTAEVQPVNAANLKPADGRNMSRNGAATPPVTPPADRKPIEARAQLPVMAWEVLRTSPPPQLRVVAATRSPQWTPPDSAGTASPSPAKHMLPLAGAHGGSLRAGAAAAPSPGGGRGQDAVSPRPLDLSGTVTVKVSHRGGRRSEAHSETSYESVPARPSALAGRSPSLTVDEVASVASWGGRGGGRPAAPGRDVKGGSFRPEHAPFVPEDGQHWSPDLSPDKSSLFAAQRNAPWRSNLLRRIDPRPPNLSQGNTLPHASGPSNLLADDVSTGKIVSPQAMDQAILKAREVSKIAASKPSVVPAEMVLM